jgi:hypothetical protein
LSSFARSCFTSGLIYCIPPPSSFIFSALKIAVQRARTKGRTQKQKNTTDLTKRCRGRYTNNSKNTETLARKCAFLRSKSASDKRYDRNQTVSNCHQQKGSEDERTRETVRVRDEECTLISLQCKTN